MKEQMEVQFEYIEHQSHSISKDFRNFKKIYDKISANGNVEQKQKAKEHLKYLKTCYEEFIRDLE